MLRVLELLLIAASLAHAAPPVQQPLITDKDAATPILGLQTENPTPRKLQGRFLHITGTEALEDSSLRLRPSAVL